MIKEVQANGLFKNILLISVLFLGCLYTFNGKQSKPSMASNRPQKLLIFTLHGGGGHQSVSKTLHAYLSKAYEVHQIDIMELMTSLDPIYSLSFKKYSGTTFYNLLLKKNWIRSTNFLGKIGRLLAANNKEKMEKLLLPLVEKHNPSCIISVIPFFNGPLYSIAEKRNLPFIIITNDLDTRNYCIGLKKPTFSKFRYTLAFDNKNMKQKIASSNLPQDCIKITGFPLRPDFYEEKSKRTIQENFGLPHNKPIILLMMGATGSDLLYTYVQELTRTEMPLHVVVCLGRNAQLRKKIENLIPLATTASFTLIDFTERVSDLMAVSHLMITKPGPNSICEALQMKLPLLLDGTTPCLYWEKFNVDFVKSYGVGDVIKSRKDILTCISKYLLNPDLYKSLKKNITNLQRPDFSQQINPLLTETLKSEEKKQGTHE